MSLEFEANLNVDLNQEIIIEVEPPNVEIEVNADANAQMEAGGEIQVDIEASGGKKHKFDHNKVPKHFRGPKTKMQRIIETSPLSHEGTQIFIWNEGQGEFDFSNWDSSASRGLGYDEFVTFGDSLKEVPFYDAAKLIICTRVVYTLINIVL